eukprot:16432019-Heterocapsa_arctica.AAC.1
MRLLQMLMRLLRRILNNCNGYVHVCYEWPKNNFGWQLEIAQELRNILPFEATFDGCSYGLVDEHGELLRKPWRVVSTMAEIVKLNKVCGHDHPHGQCHGFSAKASSYYMPAFAAEVG